MSHPIFRRVNRDDTTPQTERPAPEKVLSGDPVHTTWSLTEEADLFAGLWQSTPGKWQVSYSEWEYIRILEGYSIVTDAEGRETHLRPDDSFIINRGYTGTWEVRETTLKEYVIRL